MKSKVLSLAMMVVLSITFVMFTPATADAEERGRFRVTLIGLFVNHETWDDALQADGRGDEVFALVNTAEIWSSNRIFGALQTRQSLLYGDTDLPRQTFFFPQLQHPYTGPDRTVTASSEGGFHTGGSYPPVGGQAATRPTAPEAVRARMLPMVLWEGELRRDGAQDNAAVIIPTIWESDRSPNILNIWSRQVNNYLRSLAAEGARFINFPAPGGVVRPMVVQRDTVLEFTPDRNSFDRPIGIGGDTFDPVAALHGPATFIPAVMVLNYGSALEAALTARNNNTGRRGVVDITYSDGRNYGDGSYTIFLLVERLP